MSCAPIRWPLWAACCIRTRSTCRPGNFSVASSPAVRHHATANRGAALEPTADEIQRLQSCINDLIGVLAIPAAWAGRGSAQIVETLLNALMGMLRLDFAYAWLKDPSGGSPLEVVRLAGSLDLPANPQEMGRLLRGGL